MGIIMAIIMDTNQVDTTIAAATTAAVGAMAGIIEKLPVVFLTLS